MKYIYDGVFVKGKFLTRHNRFVAEVDIDGELVIAHVKNTGRMKELLVPGVTVYLKEADNPNRKTKYDLVTVDHNGIFINLDSQVPNRIIQMAFENNLIEGWENPDSIRREVTVGDSRLDMLVEKNGKRLYVEVKGVDLLYGNKATFPDAPTTRGVKHLRALKSIVDSGHEAMNIYLVARDDAVDFRPHYIRDPDYANTFYDVYEAGVQARAYISHNEYNSIEFGKRIPIISREEMLEELESLHGDLD